MECMVWGKLTGRRIVKDVKKTKWLELDAHLVQEKLNDIDHVVENRKGKNPIIVKKEIQQMMWNYVGVERRHKWLARAKNEIKKFKKVKLAVGGGLKLNEKLIAALDVHNMLPVCEMLIACADFRKESRGAHYRSDHPKTLAKWKKNILCKPSARGLKISTRKVAPVPAQIRKLFKKKRTYHYLE